MQYVFPFKILMEALKGYLSLVKLFFYYLVGPTIIIPGLD